MNGPSKDTPMFRTIRTLSSRTLTCALYFVLSSAPGCVARTSNPGGETNWLEACRKDPECDAGAAASDDPTSAGDDRGSDATALESDAGAEVVPEVSPEQFESAITSADSVAKVDTTGGAWRVIEVPAVSEPTIIQTPLGYLALSWISEGGKAVTGYAKALYRSTDGTHWEPLPLPDDEGYPFNGIAYGNGVYVMTGYRGAFWTSSDASNWERAEQGVSSSDTYGALEFVQGKFFAFGFRYLGVSDDGVTWHHAPVTNVQARDIAYGNGRWVMVGSGPIQVSEDAATWQAIDVPCEIEGACIEDPSGGVGQGYHTAIVFAEGAFYSDNLMSSDGLTWEANPAFSESSPKTYTSGRFLSSLGANLDLKTWSAEEAPEALRVVRPTRAAQTRDGRGLNAIGRVSGEEPATHDVGFDDGLTCETATCVLVGSRLFLVPPVGQPPLVDRVPRTDQGLPLLTDECPHSSRLFCDDYETRSGCICDPEAPLLPEYCDDVGKYACEAAFTPQGDEWELDEVAQAGCNCDHTDPDEPESFGETCTTEDNLCVAPLQCRSIPVVSEIPFSWSICTAGCGSDADCPTWTGTGFCAGEVHLECLDGTCQPRTCD